METMYRLYKASSMHNQNLSVMNKACYALKRLNRYQLPASDATPAVDL